MVSSIHCAPVLPTYPVMWVEGESLSICVQGSLMATKQKPADRSSESLPAVQLYNNLPVRMQVLTSALACRYGAYELQISPSSYLVPATCSSYLVPAYTFTVARLRTSIFPSCSYSKLAQIVEHWPCKLMFVGVNPIWCSKMLLCLLD